MTSGSQADGPVVLRRWEDLVGLVGARLPGRPAEDGLAVSPTQTLYVLRGRARAARGGGVHDDESGCVLPGVPALRLTPAAWWPGQVGDWVSRQLTHHARAQGDGVSVPVLTGRCVEAGWDGEPLLADVTVVAVVPPALLAHAQRHHRSLSTGRRPVAPGTAGADAVVLR